MSQKSKKIRDFIYLDGDKLYSLYSQVNEGLANQIVQSKLKGEQQQKSQESPVGEGGSVESLYSDLIHSTESKVLHDYMYAQLEEQIKSSISEPTNVTKDNYREKFKDTFLVKVKGNAEIADYERLKQILENINKMAQGIAYLQAVEALGMTIHQAKGIAGFVDDKRERQRYLQLLKRFDNPEGLAKEYGLLQDEKHFGYLAFFIDLFYQDQIEIVIKSKADEANTIDFRGLINKEWLRIKPDFLRMLYSGLTEFDWVMVGQITYLPDPARKEGSIFNFKNETELKEIQSSEEDISDALPSEGEILQNENSMRDALAGMSKITRSLDQTFMESKNSTEIVVAPLAIYRETEIEINS